ncbi:sulfatase-like hydrolase/transferase [Streptobacillus moniliformis]|uniref:Sulfatase n=1 Tax=Streptobacillus moniliformis (strain ATCC 14647 / DSM 12112 / NCTC 10651 / 9901) TaxID=519441 RepID=D1AX15_STRM9|nr:sulfatase-like hydrolase/transferase [Streptobacillus moniliformis]ACZ00841.1 sulfatase [Streptobacillus moniliformis DSM 12112]QXW65590.1 sulfatase-like hydrolase/transferase [Streptobacillus moniliformis]SQA14024.1 Choline-sulfatase [Streptobacillus moniliformis]
MKKNNILFIIADDLGAWALGCYGNKDAITPNIDMLAEKGKIFENFFCVSPVCSPARASIFTGRIPSQHGIHDWLDEWENGTTTEDYLKGQSTFVDVLSKNNYICCMSGKWHMGLADVPQKGFHYWYSHQKGGGPYYMAPMYKDGKLIHEEEYITDKITEYAIDFLDDVYKEDKPFFLNVNYTAPHSPWDKKNHKEEILKLYEGCKFKSCPRDPYHPWKISETFEGNEEERIQILKGYFAALTSMDFGIGEIIKKLEEKDMLKNTLIIFTSDNGMNMGHHGIFGKGNGTSPLNMYDSSVKVPFIIYKKDETEAEKVNNLLSHYDVRSTLLEYLGLDDVKDENIDYPGNSFSEILNNKKIDDDKNVVIYDEYGPTRMIRNEKYKYVHRYPDGPHEFYNLIEDVEEKVNEINNEKYSKIIDQMRKDLEIWFLNYVNKEIDGATLPIYGAGQKKFAGKWGGYAKDTFGRYHSKFIFSSDAKLNEDEKIEIENKIQ